MPIENNLIKTTNRIAYALENMSPNDQADLIAALETIANKTIPVTDMTGVVTAINNKAIPSTDLTGVVEAINNISISGGGNGTGGSMDCNCLAIALKPIVQAINDLRKDFVCVIAPISGQITQIQKEIGYWMEDGPHLGIDAPPGSFIFPKPGDYSPPIISTPDPTPTDPTTGGWTTPPIVGGIQYVEPPGGMQGTTNPTAYDDYKCDVATFIYEYVVSWYDTILQKISTIQSILQLADMLMDLVHFLRGLMQMKLRSVEIVYNVASGITMKKATERAGMTLLTATEALTLAAFIVSGTVATWMVGISFSEYKRNLVATKHDFICALRKARDVGEAREGVMEALNKNVWHIIDFGQGSGAQGLFIRTLLSDNLLANLFACDANLDPATIEGMGAGNCGDCVLCEDMDVTISVNLSSDANYSELLDKTGLVPYPLTYEITLHQALAVCVQFSTDNQTTGGGSDVPTATCTIFKDNVFIRAGAVKVGVGITQEILLPCPVAGYFDQTPIPFDGNYTIEMTCYGTVGNKPKFTMLSVSYREDTP